MDLAEENVSSTDARKWVSHGMSQLREAEGFESGLDWSSYIVDGLTVEEILGIVIAAHKYIEEHEEDKKRS